MDKKRNQFLEVMRQHSDDELLKILNDKRKEYVVDAIAAADFMQIHSTRRIVFPLGWKLA